MFIDEVQVKFKAGKWGNGTISWRKEKYIPKGGPYGGDGGNGGNIILLATPHETTLMDFRHKKIIKAEEGERWWTQNMHGKSAENLIVEVPVGTLVSDAETGEVIADLKFAHQKFILCRGGRWGFGNAHFTASTRQAPNFAELGDVGEEKLVRLELKLVADVGLIGLPNAGKSTLIQAITNVRPKIAPYPFTTLVPNLGVMEHKGRALVIEDVPGLIEGASEGKGLGDQFLRHIERTEIIIHLLDASLGEEEMIKNYQIIRKELENWDKEYTKTAWEIEEEQVEQKSTGKKVQYSAISEKKELIIFSKADLIDPEMLLEMKDNFEKETGKKVALTLSAGAYMRIDELMDSLIELIPEKIDLTPILREGADGIMEEIIPDHIPEVEKQTIPGMRFYDLKKANDPKRCSIKKLETGDFEITGTRIEEIVRMTDTKNIDAVNRVYDVLEKLWVMRKLKLQVSEDMMKEGTGFFEWEDDFEIPSVWISGKKFPLEGLIFMKE